MTYDINYSNQIKKDLKLLKKQGKDLSKFNKVINILASGQKLPEKYKDHALKGSWKDYTGCRDCHIEPDWVLIYKKVDADLIVYAISTGSHSYLDLASVRNSRRTVLSNQYDDEEYYWEIFNECIDDEGNKFLKEYYPKVAVYEWANDKDMSETFKLPSDVAYALDSAYAWNSGDSFDVHTTYYSFDSKGILISIEEDELHDYLESVIYPYREEFDDYCNMDEIMAYHRYGNHIYD